MLIDLEVYQLRSITRHLGQGRTLQLGKRFRACEFVSFDDFTWM